MNLLVFSFHLLFQMKDFYSVNRCRRNKRTDLWMRWSTGQEITFQFIRSSREPFRNIPWVMSLTWLFACVCACVPDGGWAEKQQLPTDSFLHQTGIRQGNPCQVRECVGVVGGFVGPSGELAPGPEGCVGSLVSMCIQNRSYSIRKSGKSCRCWLSLSRLGCRAKIYYKVETFWILN